jgi:hypothetical protein
LSHLIERKEKNCLNCNAQVYGKYCHICGQENIEPKETAWHLVTHFFQDITHFDGKFFSTVKLLITRPGFLSREYMAGRRVSYLNPIRMYIFTSAFFFLIFFSMMHITTESTSDKRTFTKVMESLQKNEESTRESLEGQEAGIVKDALLQRLADIRSDMELLRKDSTAFNQLKTNTVNVVSISAQTFKTVAEYDSVQKVLPAEKKDGWLQRIFFRRTLALKEKYKDISLQKALLEKFMHTFPQILFISLPLFAFLLRLLYSRRKQFFYVDHGIFSVHLYIFCFITFLAIMGLNELDDWLNWGWISAIKIILAVSISFYLYKAMRNFYQQRRAKTVWKFILLCLSALLMFVFLFAVFFIFSFFQI